MNMLNPAMSARPAPPAPQTPQSQYLAAALKQIQGQPITGGAPQLGMNLLAQGLLQDPKSQQSGSPQLPAGQGGGLSGLLSLGQKGLSRLGSLFGGAG